MNTLATRRSMSEGRVAEGDVSDNKQIEMIENPNLIGDESVHCMLFERENKVNIPQMTKKEEKIKECYDHIRSYWKEEYYMTCRKEWDQIQHLISKTPTAYQCSGCKTYWTKVSMVNDHERICPMCDTHSQPFLCNPLNTKYVLEYIDPKYYKYIFKIYQEYDLLKNEDPYDIFKETYYDNQILNQYIALKFKCEYGTSVEVYSVFQELYIKMFIVNGKSKYNTSGKDYPFYVTSFTIGGSGLSEKILSNRTEYYLNGHYCGTQMNDITEELMQKVNFQFHEDEIYPILLEFIKSGDNFRVIPRSEFVEEIDLDIGIPSCLGCGKMVFDAKDDVCDFCDRCYCNECFPEEYSFRRCDTCCKRWCYYDGKHIDYKCVKTEFISGECMDCGL
jgi:hypothetical protein